MATLKRYEVKAGRRGDLTAVVQLTEEDAKRLGAKPVGEKQQAAPANKAARKPANKSRTASSKAPAKAAPKAADEKQSAPADEK